MSYTVVSPQPSALTIQISLPERQASIQTPATLVQLDTGQYVLLGVHLRMLLNLGQLRIEGAAIVTDPTGTPSLDANGHETTTAYGVTLTPTQSQDSATVQSYTKDCANALLGEPLSNPGLTGDENVAQASIRNAIAGCVLVGGANLSTLL